MSVRNSEKTQSLLIRLLARLTSQDEWNTPGRIEEIEALVDVIEQPSLTAPELAAARVALRHHIRRRGSSPSLDIDSFTTALAKLEQL